jgi:cytochrome c oxidase subunit 4
MTDTHDAHDDHGHSVHDASHGDGHSHGGLGKYIAVFVALCILTTCSFFTYSDYWPYHDTPGIGWAFMMAVSCSKALLVMLFFMHLKYEADWKYVLTIPASIMSLLLALALVPDVGLRMRKYSSDRDALVGRASDAHAIESASAAQHEAHGDRPGH